MSFQSFGFFAFLAVTLGVCLPLARKHRTAALELLLLASLGFYAAGGARGLLVLLPGMGVTGWASSVMERTGDARVRKRAAVLGAAWHIGVLLLFKYTGFFTGGAVELPWVPLGLSFFTFQQLWLLHEVWAGNFTLPRQHRAGKLALYTFFFPAVTSGPILKPQKFFPQLEETGFLHPGEQDFAAGLYAICVGTMKKVLLADPFGVIVNNGWANLDALSAPAAWLVMLGYTLQLYFDFSGYCDIALGLGRLLGIHLPRNFDSPYRSCSVGEFWKRWHITLTSFLRECLYFTLGGSRRGTARTYLNILIIFLVSGFWHGAGWTFLVWGALHGLGQILERAWGLRREKLPRWLRWSLTFLFVNVAWVFFRAPDLSGAAELLHAAVCGGLGKPEPWLLDHLFSKEVGFLRLLNPEVEPWLNIVRILGLYGVGMTAALWPRNTGDRMDSFRPSVWRIAVLAVGMAWAMLSFSGITTFIYSNF